MMASNTRSMMKKEMVAAKTRSTGKRETSATLDLSRFCAAPSARLGHFPFEGDRAFPAQS